MVASATLWVPVFRHVIGFIGGVDASPGAVGAVLRGGETLAVAPGGIAEMFWGYPRPGCGPDEEYALVLGRRGFVRLALKHGLPLVPVYVFGNTKLFKRLQLPPLVEAASNLLRTSLVLFWGRWGLPVPFQVPLLYAAGSPLDAHCADFTRMVGGAPAAATNVSKGPRLRGLPGWSPSEAEVGALHAQFCAALVQVFEGHKTAYGWGHKRLVLV